MSEIEKKCTSIPKNGILQISGNLTFDFFSGMLNNTSSNKSVPLKGVQLNTFLFLASRPNEVVTYKSMSVVIWNDNSYDRTRIQMTLSHVRNKMIKLELGYNPIVPHTNDGYSFLTVAPTENNLDSSRNEER